MQHQQQMMQQGYGMQMNMPPGFMLMGPGGGGVLSPHPMFMGGGLPGQSPGAHLYASWYATATATTSKKGIHQADNNNND
jgi:hypothetical protein